MLVPLSVETPCKMEYSLPKRVKMLLRLVNSLLVTIVRIEVYKEVFLSMIQFTPKYREIEKEFINFFGYSVPLKRIPPSESTDGIIASMQECLVSRQDILNIIYDITNDVDSIYLRNEH